MSPLHEDLHVVLRTEGTVWRTIALTRLFRYFKTHILENVSELICLA
jgi:hypothetical protein